MIIYGTRNARIKRFTDDTQQCPHCKSIGIEAAIFKTYFHVFFIPFWPAGIKSSKLWCHACGQLIRIDSLQAKYEKDSRIPVYLYSGLILLAFLVLLMANANIKTQREKKNYVENPRAGDEYLISEDRDKSSIYYFYKIVSIKGDSVAVNHGNLEYSGFVSKMQSGDFFVEDEEIYFTKKELREMLEKGEITSVER